MLNEIIAIDDKRVHFELVEARKLWGIKGTDLDALLKALAFLYFNCPKECSVLVMDHIRELEMRINMLGKVVDNTKEIY